MSENITSMAIFTSINEISSIINKIDAKTDTFKLYNLVNLILNGVSLLLIIGLFFYIRKL